MRELLLIAVLLGVTAPAVADDIDDRIVELRTDPSWKVRVSAEATLGRIDDPRVVPALVEALAKDQDDEVRGAVVMTLRKIAIASTSRRERSAITVALSRAGRKDADEVVRKKARSAVRKIRAAHP